MQLPDLITLSDGRPGLRTLLQVETREPSPVDAPASSAESGSQPSTLNSQPVLDFVASTDTLDRYHEIIDPAGWRLDTYRRNPVFQNAHNYGDVIHTIGKALITEVRTANTSHLFQRVQFATDVNPMARIAHGLYKGGFLNAVSVGFIPVRWENGTTDANFRRKYLEQELLEVSAVAIPANPDALALGLKAGAVHKSDLTETLELLRSTCAAFDRPTCPTGPTGPTSPPTAPITPMGPISPISLLTFARELRRILRRA
jgi:HK97 family phage prohead protease